MDPPLRRWAVLAAGLLATTAGCAFPFGLPFLIPSFRAEGLTLARAGVLAAAPQAGLLVTLVAWGAAADRWGERRVMTTGLGTAGVVLLVAPRPSVVWLFVAGAAGAAVNASSGRLILGWFAARERGLAMGVRQTSVPLGVAIAALVLPSRSASAGLAFLGVFCLAATVLAVLVVRDPPAAGPAPGEGRNPYRTPVLWRIHAASALLVVPQATVATFALVFLVEARRWDASAAGAVLAAVQACGAGARLAAGWWSDRAGSRLRPMRLLAAAISVAVAVLAGTAPVAAPPVAALPVAALPVAALLVAAVLTVSPNGLAYTAVAERAGRAWAGRALGIQNTAQNLVGAATVPVMAVVVETAGYGVAFAAAAAFPVVAAMVIPRGPGRDSTDAVSGDPVPRLGP